MTLTWATIPLPPLRCILEHLSPEDAMAAMTTCRHWRDAVLLYEGHRETLKLRAKQLEKNLFLTRIFRRHTRSLQIYLDCGDIELEKFLDLVLPQFFDKANLQELIFIGPSYVQQNLHMPYVLLKRKITESLVFKHQHCLKKLVFLGCKMKIYHNENEIYSQKHVEYFAQRLKFSKIKMVADNILSNANQHLMQHSALTHLVIDYEHISTSALETLAHLPNFRHLSLNITNKNHTFPLVDWDHLQDLYKGTLHVAVAIIAVPYRRFPDIMDHVLVEGLSLISLKVLFCNSLFTPLLSHISRLYQTTLQEVVWVDSPYDSTDPYHRIVRPMRHPQPDTYAHVNPFVLLCWQCDYLQRLVIHGYWVWQYDLLGFVRLRKTLTHLEISAIYNKQDRFCSALRLSEEGAVRVLAGVDRPVDIDAEYIQEVNEFTEFKWSPMNWSKMHPALRLPRCTAEQRADYIISEICRQKYSTMY